MTMFTGDYITLPYNALWGLLEADSAWAAGVKPGNRIKWTGSALVPQKRGKQDADFPEAELRLGAFSTSLAQRTPTFGQCAWDEEITQVYELFLTHTDLRLAAADVLKVQTLAALRSGVPRLGLSFVTRVGAITGEDQDTLKARADGTLRLVTVFHIPVTMRCAAP